jgi:hypothetical protein
MPVTVSGISSWVKPWQPAKALSPMSMTLPSAGIRLVLQPATRVLLSVWMRQLLLLW